MPKCQVCLEGDDARKGDVNRYRAPEGTDLLGGWFHMACAFKVGYNEWDEDE
ncbi:MAG: hypothetical protein IPK85_03195 [Gemmatimonadetes bacterium]|nr:hypothetical protein [Gemmatimonadota bacterium]